MGYLANKSDVQVYQPAIDYFSGTGSTAQFTLSRPVASVAQIIVSVANVIQNPNTFSVNNNILTLGGNAPTGTNNIWVQYQTAVIQLNQPGQGTVGTNQLIDLTVTQKKLAVGVGNQVGEVSFFAMSSAPSGWIKANGAAVARTSYVDLFAAIGTTFGAGNGSTTFNVPDLRGEFPRGWDDGRGADSGRTFGAFQDHAIQMHSHTVYTNVDYSRGSVYPAVTDWYNEPRSFQTQTTGGAGNFAPETRPRNVALLACIKY